MTALDDLLGPARHVLVAGSTVEVRASEPRAWEARVVVAVSLQNQAKQLAACLESIGSQEGLTPRPTALILDDGSEDEWAPIVAQHARGLSLLVGSVRCGSATRARNVALEFVEQALPNARWVARLDADDRFSTPRSLAVACVLGDESGAEWVLGGNRLVSRGELLAKENPAGHELLNANHVLAILDAMARGVATNELPSCNLLLRAGCGLRYPEVASAEDHWLVASLLLTRASFGAVLTEPYFCDYDLGGHVTATNRQTSAYTASRVALFEVASGWVRGLAGGR